jgi:hypothetical protein
MIAWSWETGQLIIAALAPLVAVPLGVITFYLRSLYENQMNRHAELVRRFELVERMSGDLAKTVSSFALDYTTKEEWLRECMYARGRIERLAETLAGERDPSTGDRASTERNCHPEHSEGSRWTNGGDSSLRSE